jgi:hypothetical protein
MIAALLFLGKAVTPVYGCATPIGSIPPTMVVLLRLVTEVGSLLQLAALNFPSDWLWGSRRVLCAVPQQALSHIGIAKPSHDSDCRRNWCQRGWCRRGWCRRG